LPLFEFFSFSSQQKIATDLTGKHCTRTEYLFRRKITLGVRYLAAAAAPAGAWSWKELHAGSCKLNRLPFLVSRFQRNELWLRETGNGFTPPFCLSIG
jgi:hypothetical protein